MNPAKPYGNSLGRFVAYSSEYLNFLHPRLGTMIRKTRSIRLISILRDLPVGRLPVPGTVPTVRGFRGERED